ncbi:MAG: hypothetical protein KGM44_00910, partial [bacterium]|nr:hypothetical protein [bacterium]
MLFQWFYHASRRGSPRFLMVADHMNYLTFEDPAAVNLCRRALKLALAGDHYGAAETANVTYPVAEAVGAALRRGFRFSIGAEVDNDPRNRPDAQNIVEAMRPDGLVRSVHFVPITHPEHGEGWMWPFDNPEFKDLYLHVGVEQTWELYASAVVDAVEKLPGNILGHFFVPGKFGFWPSDAKLEEYEDRVIAACRQRGMAIEFNTRVLYKSDDPALVERWLAAHRRLLRKAKAADVGIAVGSDAHSPMHQGAAFERVLAMLDELGINELVFPVAGRLARVALKASEELIAAVAQPVTPRPGSSITGLGRKELGLPEEPEVSIASRNEEARAARRRGGRVARATRERPS